MPSDASVVFGDVCFRHDTASDPIFSGLSVHFAHGFTGVVGPNGAGKTTLLRLATGGLSPESLRSVGLSSNSSSWLGPPAMNK